MSLVERRARLDPKLVHERGAQLPERSEGIGLSIASIQRDHEMPPQPLAQRVLGHELGQLAALLCVRAEGEVRLDPILAGGQAELRQARDVRLREGLEREVGQRIPAPQRERPPQRGGRDVGRTRQRPPAFAGQLLPNRTASIRSGSTARTYPGSRVTR